MLTRKELLDILQFGQTILECRSPDEFREVALDLLLQIFGCPGGNFFFKRGRKFLDPHSILSRGSISNKKNEEYRRYYYRLDPFSDYFPLPRPVMTLDEIITPEKFLRSEFYNDLLRPQSIRYQLSLSTPVGKAWCGVALYRPPGTEGYGPDDLAKARMIIPYLTGAMERLAGTNDSQNLERLVLTMAAQLPFEGMIALDETCTNFFQDVGAQKILAMLAEKEMSEAEPPPPLPHALITACSELLEDDARGKKRSRRLKLKPADGSLRSSVTAEIRLIHQPSESPLFLIGLNRGGKTTDGICRLQKKGISRRELDVIHQVLEGRTNAEVAETLFISEYTVQNHLQAIYRKLGIKNRTSLIRELMVLPMFTGPAR